MPLIFAANSSSQREQFYANELETQYEFPKTYRARVKEGDIFIYYRGTKSPDGAGYFGAGVVGPVRDSKTAGRFVCEVLDVVFFDSLVELRDPVGHEYIEDVGPNRVNLQQGVRLIADDKAKRILDLGIVGVSQAAPPAPIGGAVGAEQPNGKGAKPQGRPSQDYIDAIFRYSTEIVQGLLSDRHPAAEITVMPDNNPGYDIRVKGASPEFIEVKGTGSSEISFSLSEGQRQFSELRSDDFSLIVVYDIDLEAKTHKHREFVGPIRDTQFVLEPVEYRVRLHPEEA